MTLLRSGSFLKLERGVARGVRRLDVLDNLRFVCAVRKQMHYYPEEGTVHEFPPLLESSHSFTLSAFSASVLPSNIKL